MGIAPVRKTYLLNKYAQFLPGGAFTLFPRYTHRNFLATTFLIFGIFPIIGYFRRKYIKNAFKKQLMKEQSISSGEIKNSLIKLNINFNQDTEYMIVIVCSDKQLKLLHQEKKANSFVQQKPMDPQLFHRIQQLRKKVFVFAEEANNRINNLTSTAIVFIGNKQVYDGVTGSNGEKMISFSSSQQVDIEGQRVFLITQQQNKEGQLQNKLLMEWQLGVNITSILKQIGKHRHKKFVQSMSF